MECAGKPLRGLDAAGHGKNANSLFASMRGGAFVSGKNYPRM